MAVWRDKYCIVNSVKSLEKMRLQFESILARLYRCTDDVENYADMIEKVNWILVLNEIRVHCK